MENLFPTADPDMKFILTDHIYETAAFAGPTTKENYGYSANWYEDSTLREYYRMMWRYKDKIVFKITGHDHLTDLLRGDPEGRRRRRFRRAPLRCVHTPRAGASRRFDTFFDIFFASALVTARFRKKKTKNDRLFV